MPQKLPKQKPNIVVRFETAAPASPGRVAEIARMVDDGLTALLGRKPSDGEFTLVVHNFQMRVEVRANSSESVPIGRKFERAFRDPTSLRDLPKPQQVAVAHVLRESCSGLKDNDGGLTVANQSRSHSTLIDATLIGALKGIEEQSDDGLFLRGTTESVTPVLAVGRRADTPDSFYAVLRLDTGPAVKVPIHHRVVDAAMDAVKRGCHAHVAVSAVWRSTDGTHFPIAPARCLVENLTLLPDRTLSGRELLEELAKFVDADAAEAAGHIAYDERGIDWTAFD